MRFFQTVFLFGLFTVQCLGQQASLSKQHATEDFDFFIKTLEAKHPNPAANFPNYRAYKDALVASFPESMLYDEFALSFSKFANLFQDGHTFVANSKIPDTAKVLPFDVATRNNKVFVSNAMTVALGKEFEGAEITGINGMEINAVLNQIQPLIGGETEEHKMARLEYGFAGYVYRVLGEVAALDILHENKASIIHPTLIDRTQWLQLSITANRPKFGCQSIDPKTSLLSFTEMADLNKREFKQFLETTFKALKAQNVENLIIDLRYNGGGNFLYGQMLLAYLTDKPYTVHHKYQYDMDGKKTNRDMLEIAPSSQKNSFSGKLYFLTGPYTYSSAASIVAAVKFNKLGQIVGKPIGQPYAGFIDMTTFSLPNSKLLCGTSTVYYEYAGVTGLNRHLSIEPDIDTDEDALSVLLERLK